MHQVKNLLLYIFILNLKYNLFYLFLTLSFIFTFKFMIKVSGHILFAFEYSFKITNFIAAFIIFFSSINHTNFVISLLSHFIITIMTLK